MVLQNTGKYRADRDDSNKREAGSSTGPREESSESRIRLALENDRIDSKYGFDRVRDVKERTGYLINMHTAEVLDEDKRLVAAMDYYFIEMDGSRFKVSLTFQPYFLILARKECEQEVIQFLSKRFAGTIHKINVIEKEDLDLLNHLSGIKQRYIKLSFMSQNEMMKVRREILTAVNKNKEREKKDQIYAEMLTNALTSAAAIEHAKKTTDHMENILDIREHDVPYHVRVSIDMQIFCGTWYTVKSRGTETPIFTKRDDIIERPDPIVLAFDIETTKLPLKFPDSQTDQIMMISYMIDGQGYLITNREIISVDVEDFEYTPKPEFEGQFIVFNEENELGLIQKFFDHIMDVKPHIFVTYNGDFFDWPFVEARAAVLGLDMKQEIGFSKIAARDGTYACRPAMHMDCLCWVKRDSYLPVGSQGLKAVAKAKLRYDPVELDPEEMCRMAAEQPQVLSNYSVSDAVATYYLYMKYVHPFIFALCTIIPLEPDEVLRKGSGTLCESLLMVQAFHANIVFPNKQVEELNKLTADGHVLETETYVGGHVEALESGECSHAGILAAAAADVQAFHANIVFPNKQVEELNKLTADGHVLETETYVGGHVEALESGECSHAGILAAAAADVQAFHANIVFPNKQVEELNKLTADGHVLETETYVGGHVEALESGECSHAGILAAAAADVQAFHANIVFPNKQVEELNKLTADGHVLETETYVGGHVEALESGECSHAGILAAAAADVQAFHANIVFPNKQVEELNKLTADGHVLETETYVGGHVEALESGVFRADIKCKFKIVPSAVDKLMETTEKTMKHAIEVEEGIPLDLVTNFDEVCAEIKTKLQHMKDHPRRDENPLIYHLDVGAMYPNIILTNRLQPSAMVNTSICAVCDYNRPGAACQRHMEWMWRGDYLPATRSEYQRIQQQLETEKFPPLHPGGPTRAFHSLPKEDQAAYEKKRLADYCRVAYKKTKVTRTEVRTTTICQKENSFYVDTVRAFRDRRYEYKALNKQAKAKVAEAVASGDAAEIKSAKSREVLFDSLQLAHKCILNSFYGYVMRRGARWHSMEMAGIVCYTGANIIMKAREIIEQIGRPLELDTDGIWCILPSSFPENVTVLTTHAKKKKINVSFPNAVLNAMVKDHFTNDQYFELVDPELKKYEQRAENSIFFEVDGPYLAMVLPASKEEGKRLKKRYAVFNFDGSLAELKGFEVKRRGELQLIKIFQSSVFEAFLKGNDLKSCYSAVAKVADYWLDVLYSKGSNMPDSELFELISENRSMSKKLEDYGGQKSTSISTAKRLAEFLGDQMVKDAGLACRFIISKKPEGAPVTERAIPLAIFQSPAAVKRHHLRRWLKDNSITEDIDIRDVLDWAYYIERLSGAIQKIITIPAAMQGLDNPVPRCQYPDWLHKKMLAKTDKYKTRKITDMFSVQPKELQQSSDDGQEPSTSADGNMETEIDIEDIGKSTTDRDTTIRPIVHTVKRKREESPVKEPQHWREALGAPPPFGNTKEERKAWILFQKKKWLWQMEQRGLRNRSKRGKMDKDMMPPPKAGPVTTLGGFLRKAQRTLLNTPWQIIQVAETPEPGLFKVWALVGSELHQIKLSVPRIFYVNQRVARAADSGQYWRKCSRVLPRAHPVLHLYQYTVPEHLYREHQEELTSELCAPEIEGIYETQMSLEFRVLVQLGCICTVDPQEARKMIQFGSSNMDSFALNQLQFKSVALQPYLQKQDGVPPVKHIYLYQHSALNSSRSMWALVLPPVKRAYIYVLDTVKTNQVPNMNTLYLAERTAKINLGTEESSLPGAELTWEVVVETESRAVSRHLQRALQRYKDERCGPTLLALQATLSPHLLLQLMPGLSDFPLVPIHVRDVETLYSALEWQRIGARAIVRHYLALDAVLQLTIEQCRYFHVPLGNMPSDPTVFGADLFYARHLVKHNFVLWCSNRDLPDLGGRETDDNRLVSEVEELSGCTHIARGAYNSVCVELDTDALGVCALLQAHSILHAEGTSLATAFGANHANIQDVMANAGANASMPYDETAQCSAAFKILRTMIASWLRDVTQYKNVFADLQISHFYRWLKTPTSLLYDPALRRTLYNLMKKLFLMLVAEFKRLGSHIVFADFNKILLCTKKNNVMDGIGYVEFVVQSIRNKELFHGIDIRYKQCWSYLLWLDEANYAGVQGKLPEGLTEVGSSQLPAASENGDDEDSAITMQWNLANFLPAPVREPFTAAVAGFLSAAYSQPKELPNLIRGEISQKLFQVTEKINSRYPALRPADIGRQPGLKPDAFSGESKPALLYVNAVCKVFSLDPTLEDEVTLLRRNLLRLISVGEFSAAAEWRDACNSCLLTEIICNVCNHCRDLDLCRDTNTDVVSDVPVCLCPTCGTPYENQELEWRLIEIMNRRTMSYILQDLICKRCHQVKRENMTMVCECAGEFTLMVPTKEVLSQLNTFKTIADYYKMPLLSELIEYHLSNT
ncbi:DNA polymerase epsilon catalytic subunit 1 [Helicoverpa armigera]|uniref:DNA polymerase epsilon catalytic subunit 1 n=1 Tax=Helicoverpa armigera TaxID=29058 RepID=UPI003082B008